MSRLLIVVGLSLVLTGLAVAQGDKARIRDSVETQRDLNLQADSSLETGSSTSALSLTPYYGDTSRSILQRSGTGSEIQSWLSIPGEARSTPLSIELFPVQAPYPVSEPGSLPFKSDSWLLESKSNLLSPWRLELKDRENYRVWQTILGSVQAGGVAYLLYLHIKKYGLK
jgi:hypothetical protein